MYSISLGMLDDSGYIIEAINLYYSLSLNGSMRVEVRSVLNGILCDIGKH